MAKNIRKTVSPKQRKCDASSISNKRGMAKRAKTKSNKTDRQELKREQKKIIAEIDYLLKVISNFAVTNKPQ